jgi:CRP-like cAMP-binding protein
MRATGALRALFARSRLFSNLDDSQFQVFVEALQHRRFSYGEPLFFQGQSGDSLAVVLSGTFRVEVERPGGKHEVLESIGSGDVIGEMTCVDPAPRSASVTAVADAEILELDRGTLDALRRSAPAIWSAVLGGILARTTERLAETNLRIERALSRLGLAPTVPQLPIVTEAGDVAPRQVAAHEQPNRLRKLAGLKGFTEAELGMLLRVATPREYAQGDVLLAEGAPCESCLVLTSGEVEVTKQVGGRERRLAVLPVGSIVGQIALVQSGARQATVRASSSVTALELGRHNFERLLAARAPLALRFQEQVATASIRQLRLANERLATVLDRVDQAHEAASAPSTEGPEPHEQFVEATWGPPPEPRPVAAPRVPTPAQPRGRGRRSSIPTEVIDLSGRGDDVKTTVAFIQAALSEWGMRVEDLDAMEARVPDGHVSRKEALLREKR